MAEAIGKDFGDLPLLPPESDALALPISGFGGGTLIESSEGLVPVDWLRPGDEVLTHKGEWVPVLWVGRDCFREPPDTVAAAFLVPRNGARRTVLAARHRVALTGWEVELHMGLDAVLAEAAQITGERHCFPTARHGGTCCSILVTEQPQIIQADGIWVETLQLNAAALGCLSEPALEAVSRLDLDHDAHTAPALPCLEAWEVDGLGFDLTKMVAYADGPAPGVW